MIQQPQESFDLAINRAPYDIAGHQVSVRVDTMDKNVLRAALPLALNTVQGTYNYKQLPTKEDLSKLGYPGAFSLTARFDSNGKIGGGLDQLLTFDQVSYNLTVSILQGLISPAPVSDTGLQCKFNYTFEQERLKSVHVAYGVTFRQLASLVRAWQSADIKLENGTPVIKRQIGLGMVPVIQDITVATQDRTLNPLEAHLTVQQGVLDIALSDYLFMYYQEQALLACFSTFVSMATVALYLM